MSTSLYDLTVPVFTRALGNLSAILEKGRVFAAEQKLDPLDLPSARLIEDMAPLSGQIQRASDTAKGAIVRIAGIANQSFPDTETTFEEMQARIAATIAFLKTAPREAFEGREDARVVLPTPGGDIAFTGRSYATDYALPNFFFHVTIAYAILRHRGAPIGKLDYLGRR